MTWRVGKLAVAIVDCIHSESECTASMHLTFASISIYDRTSALALYQSISKDA
jgi:hypothetical protein